MPLRLATRATLDESLTASALTRRANHRPHLPTAVRVAGAGLAVASAIVHVLGLSGHGVGSILVLVSMSIVSASCAPALLRSGAVREWAMVATCSAVMVVIHLVPMHTKSAASSMATLDGAASHSSHGVSSVGHGAMAVTNSSMLDRIDYMAVTTPLATAELALALLCLLALARRRSTEGASSVA